jgi:hypothetical protein
MNFIEKCAKGLASPEDIGDYIETWRRCATSVEVWEFSGMTEQEYNEKYKGKNDLS